MPFQVIYSTRSRVFEQVNLVTAGEDQYQICTPTIYLEAIVEGDLAGHVIEWEQIGGTLVTLQQANTLTPFFDAVDSTDKTFRIYIDRYTPYEQYDDVTIWKTPTSLCALGWEPDQQYYQRIVDPDPVQCDDILSFVSVTVPPPTNLQGEELGSQTIVEVSWSHPPNVVEQAYIAQYKVVENGLVVDDIPDVPIWNAGEGTGPPTEPLLYNGTFAEYRIDTYYNIAGVEYVRESCTKDFSALTAPLVKGYNDAVFGMGWDPDKQYYTRVNYLNVVINEPDKMYGLGWDPDKQYYTRVNYGNIVLNETTVMYGLGWDPDQQWINITRYDPSGIGSG